MDQHDEKWCYINPQGQAFKPDVRVRRIAAAKKRGA
jgi:hypothetical protein